MELTLDRSAHDFKDTEMEIALTTLSVTGQYRPEIGSLELSPYVGLGLGYSFNSVELTSDFKDLCDFLDVSCKTSIDNSLTLHLNAGTDYFINDNIALFGEGRYTISSASFDLEVADDFGTTVTVSGDLNLDRFDIRAGVKYFF